MVFTQIGEFFENLRLLVIWGVNNSSCPRGYVTRVMWVNNKYRFPELII